MRVLAIAAAAALLAGCTDADWAHVMSYAPTGPSVHDEPPPPEPVQAATATAAPTAVSPMAVPGASRTPPAGTGGLSSSATVASTSVSEKAQRECIQWADERAQDTTNQKFDDDTALKVRDATYADCMTWAVRLHR
jgi:hypothetical protein